MLTRSVRATAEERRRPLTGDDFIAQPIGSLTQAVTIDCPARDVCSAYRFNGLPRWLTMLIVPAIHYVMERRQLLGIASRAEQGRQAERAPSSGGTGRARVSV
jgi:hypothetical protein